MPYSQFQVAYNTYSHRRGGRIIDRVGVSKETNTIIILTSIEKVYLTINGFVYHNLVTINHPSVYFMFPRKLPSIKCIIQVPVQNKQLLTAASEKWLTGSVIFETFRMYFKLRIRN